MMRNWSVFQFGIRGWRLLFGWLGARREDLRHRKNRMVIAILFRQNVG